MPTSVIDMCCRLEFLGLAIFHEYEQVEILLQLKWTDLQPSLARAILLPYIQLKNVLHFICSGQESTRQPIAYLGITRNVIHPSIIWKHYAILMAIGSTYCTALEPISFNPTEKHHGKMTEIAFFLFYLHQNNFPSSVQCRQAKPLPHVKAQTVTAKTFPVLGH